MIIRAAELGRDTDKAATHGEHYRLRRIAAANERRPAREALGNLRVGPPRADFRARVSG